MNSNEILESTSTNNWKTVTDLFEQVFGPESELNENENNSHESCERRRNKWQFFGRVRKAY